MVSEMFRRDLRESALLMIEKLHQYIFYYKLAPRVVTTVIFKENNIDAVYEFIISPKKKSELVSSTANLRQSKQSFSLQGRTI